MPAQRQTQMNHQFRSTSNLTGAYGQSKFYLLIQFTCMYTVLNFVFVILHCIGMCLSHSDASDQVHCRGNSASSMALVYVTGAGYIKVEDVRRIIGNLGRCLSHRAVKDLCTNVADTTGRHRGERVYYRDLTDTEVPA